MAAGQTKDVLVVYKRVLQCWLGGSETEIGDMVRESCEPELAVG